jgi:hypothetical protein
VVFSWYSGSFTNKTDRHDIAEILLKVALNTIKTKLHGNTKSITMLENAELMYMIHLKLLAL